MSEDEAIEQRRVELRRGLAEVHERIEAAAGASGRDPEDICLIAVTKFFPLQDLQLLAELGQRHFGESRDQEASEKIPALRTSQDAPMHTHFVGQVQSKKARSLTRYVDTVHSVDRNKLVKALDRATQSALEAQERSQPLGVLIQVNLDHEESGDRGGIAPVLVPELAAKVASTEHLELRGLMAVAPNDVTADQKAEAFARLADTHGALLGEHPEATWMSAGMTADLEAAIHAGATHLRVGGAILGSRYSGR